MTMSLREHRIFDGIDPSDLTWLSGQVAEVRFGVGEPIIRQGEQSREVYLLLEGEVELYREEDGVRLVLGTLTAGDYFGEMAALSGAPRSATAVARQPVLAAVLTMPAPERIAEGSPAAAVFHQVTLNHAREQGRRLLEANDRALSSLRDQLQQSEERNQLSLVLIVLVALMSLYAYLVGTIDSMTGSRMLLTSLGVAAGSAVGAGLFIHQSSASWATFGLTLRDLWPSLAAALRWSVGMCVVLTGLKALACALFEPWSDLPLLVPVPMRELLAWGGVYLLSSLIQEFAARSFLHTAFDQLLAGPGRRLWAILLSNLIFSVFHLHYNVPFALMTFASGLVFGAFWSRHRSLAAVSLLHFVTGVWAMDALGLFALPGFR